MYAFELFEAGKPQVIVTYPGRFQPFHQGHAAVYAQLQKKFGRDNVYILTSNDTSGPKSPFSFSDKYQLMTAAGVPGDRIIETNNMYALPEAFDKASTIFVAAVGEPDKKRLNPDSVLKKDKKDAEGNVIKPAGSPGYFLSYDRPEPKVAADQHGYVIVIPEVKKTITIKGKAYDVSHGTECRNLWNAIRNDQKARVEFLTQLYGQASNELAHIFDKIPAMAEDVAAVSQDTTSPIHGGLTESVLNENEEYVLYLNGEPSAQYTDTGRLKADLMHLKKKYPNLQYEIKKEICKEVPVTGVAEGPLNEYRDALYNFVKSKFPTWPEYVLKDFLYAQAKGIRDEEELKDWLERNQKDFGRVKWRLEKLPITLDIFTPRTQRMIKQREGGSSNPFQVPRDAERHAQQLKMIQQQGVRTEPIIVAKLSNGYDLIEGWHRTIQHLQQYPEGYIGPAWVAYGATYKSELNQGVAEDAAGVGVVAKNKKMARDPRYSMSITKDVKPETPKDMLRAFRLSEQEIDPADFEIRNLEKLDRILLECCEMVIEGQKENSKLYGMVAACVLDPENRAVFGINTFDDGSDSRKHAERVAIENYTKRYGNIPKGSIIITTLSPCCHPMDERYGESCTDLINQSGVHKVYCGYKDPTQEPEDKMFHVMCTRNEKIKSVCKKFADTFLDEGILPHGVDKWGDPKMPPDFKPASYVFPGIIGAYKVAQEKGMKVVRSEGGRFKLAPISDPNPELVPNPDLEKIKNKVRRKVADLQSIIDSVGKTITLKDFIKQYGGYGTVHKKMAGWNKILRDTPTFIEKPTSINESSHSVSERQMMRMIKRFMHLAVKELKISKVPHIVVQPHIESHDGQATFGRFVNEEEKIYLGVADRHPVDILRTLAHELVHFKQYEQGRMEPDSGTTGSPIENEAHAIAGVLMRHFNKKYPDAIKSKPLEVDENFADGRNPQDKGDSKRYNVPTKGSISSLRKIAKQGGRRGQLAHWMANMKSGKKKHD